MAKVYEENKYYKFFAPYVLGFTVGSLFSDFHVNGKENIPEDGAVLFTPNHCNALMDPLVLLHALGRPVAFAARSDIFRNPKVASILRALKILPMARERDGLSEVAKNYTSIDEIIECMARNFPVGIYAEGRHRCERGMLPLKKRCFMICKTASEELHKKVYVVPTGVWYENLHGRFASATVSFGKAIEISEYFEAHKGLTDAEIYQQLCTEVRETNLQLMDMGKKNERKLPLWKRIAFGIVGLPVALVCLVPSLPISLSYLILKSRTKDRAWMYTYRFALRVALPIFMPFDYFLWAYMSKILLYE